jgi:hypothetical protein
MDNGSEPTSRHFLNWGIENLIELACIQPSKPVQKRAHRESPNGHLRMNGRTPVTFVTFRRPEPESLHGGANTTRSDRTQPFCRTPHQSALRMLAQKTSRYP